MLARIPAATKAAPGARSLGGAGHGSGRHRQAGLQVKSHLSGRPDRIQKVVEMVTSESEVLADLQRLYVEAFFVPMSCIGRKPPASFGPVSP